MCERKFEVKKNENFNYIYRTYILLHNINILIYILRLLMFTFFSYSFLIYYKQYTQHVSKLTRNLIKQKMTIN